MTQRTKSSTHCAWINTSLSLLSLDMLQSLPPPSHPQREFVQSGGPSDSPILIDQMPGPPTDEIGSGRIRGEQQQQQGSKSQIKPPTPQLICLE